MLQHEGLLCSVRNRMPGCDPLIARYANTAPTGLTALSLHPNESFISFLNGLVLDCLI